VLAKLDQRFSGSLKSGPQFNRWGWEWSGEIQRRSFDGGITQGRNSASGSAYLIPLPELRVGASINYDQVDNFSINGRTSGTGLGLFADWTPSNRTTVSASAKRQYYGTTGKIAASHRFGLFTGALSFDKSLLTSSDGSILSVNPSALFSAGGFSSALNPVFAQLANQNLLQTYASAVGGGVLSDFLILSNTLSASMAYASPKNSMVLSATRSKRDTDASRAQSTFGFFQNGNSPSTLTPVNLTGLNTSNLSFDWTHNLDSKNALGLKVSRVMVDSASVLTGQVRTRVNLLQSTYRTQLTSDTSAIFGLRHSAQRSDGAAALNYDETAIFGTIDVRF
jgi:uncharacterized protein (PEP-CTERM system associated)